MNKYPNNCDLSYVEYGPYGGERAFSYASWCWDEIAQTLRQANNADDIWDFICADLEGAYFLDGYGEQDIRTTDLRASVQRIVDESSELEISFIRIIKDGYVVLEVAAQDDAETENTSGISVLCDYLWDKINS